MSELLNGLMAQGHRALRVDALRAVRHAEDPDPSMVWFKYKHRIRNEVRSIAGVADELAVDIFPGYGTNDGSIHRLHTRPYVLQEQDDPRFGKLQLAATLHYQSLKGALNTGDISQERLERVSTIVVPEVLPEGSALPRYGLDTQAFRLPDEQLVNPEHPYWKSLDDLEAEVIRLEDVRALVEGVAVSIRSGNPTVVQKNKH